MMRFAILLIVVMSSCSKRVINIDDSGNPQFEYLQDWQIELAEPTVVVDSFLFKESATVELSFGLEDANILYSFGFEEMQEYDGPLVIDESVSLMVMARKKGYNDSSKSIVQLRKVSDKLEDAEILVSPVPNENYPGNGVSSLTDLEKGTLNFKDGNLWLGFQSKQVIIDVLFPEPQELEMVCLSLLSDEKSWIFRPEKIALILDQDTMSVLAVPKTSKNEIVNINYSCVPIAEKRLCTELKVVIESMDAIPTWHAGKGTAPWLFIDEIIVK